VIFDNGGVAGIRAQTALAPSFAPPGRAPVEALTAHVRRCRTILWTVDWQAHCAIAVRSLLGHRKTTGRVGRAPLHRAHHESLYYYNALLFKKRTCNAYKMGSKIVLSHCLILGKNSLKIP
jgi:hypothetical protein